MKKKSSLHPRYAFFDLDRTLLGHDTMLLFCNYILRQMPLRRFFLLLFLPALLLSILRLLTSAQLKGVFFSFLFYMRAPALEYHAENFVQTVLKPLFFPELLALIQKHRRAGDFLILNTASIEPYVKYIAKELKFHAYYASKIELGDPMPLIPKIFKNNKGYTKIESMEDLLAPKLISHYQKHFQGKTSSKNSNIPRLRKAYTYTDSLADLALINLAEDVIIVQPSQRRLRQMASQRDWKLIEPKGSITKGAWDDIPCRFFISLLQLIGLYKAAPPLSK